jgi:hypothetical protein
MGKRGVAKRRNQTLFDRLVDLKKDPFNPTVQNSWIEAAADLVTAVLKIQFSSQVDGPDSEDLQQAALLEFHRVGLKLAALTEKTGPDNLFRILYSVAKFSMLRELTRLHRGFYKPSENRVDLDSVIELDCDSGHPYVESTDAPLDEESRDKYVQEYLPMELVLAVGSCNGWAKTRVGPAVTFVALQLLRGRKPSMSFVRSWWKIPDAALVERYAGCVARAAIVKITTMEAVRKQVFL